MVDGRYVYCIIEWNESNPPAQLGNIGIMENAVYMIPYRQLGALVSSIPFKQMESDMNDIVAHQRVVEAARELSTVLPVRFGVILKTDEAVRKLLATSYKDYRSKIAQLHGMDEMGIKVLINKSSLKKIREMAHNSQDVVKLRDEISTSKPGTSYFLKLKLDDALRNETLKIVDRMVGDINRGLAQAAQDTRLLKNEIGEIVLNAAYLVDRDKAKDFEAKVKELKEKYEKEGMTLHRSGPWAPYSFC